MINSSPKLSGNGEGGIRGVVRREREIVEQGMGWGDSEVKGLLPL